MAFVFELTVWLRADPNVLVADFVAVFGGDVDGEVRKAAGHLASPVSGISDGDCGGRREQR